MMIRLINLIRCGYQKPKVMNITQLLKRQAAGNKNYEPGKIQITQSVGPTILPLKSRPMGNRHKMGEVQAAIQSHQKPLGKQQLEINQKIKIQTNTYNLYQIHYLNRQIMTPTNLINLLIKVLELRWINKRQNQETDKLDRIVKSLMKKLAHIPPEDLVRFLFSLKSVNMYYMDLKRLQPFVMAIIQEFSQKNIIESGSTVYNSFEVISVQANLKLLHSLDHLHRISGSYFEPVLSNLIKMSLQYLHFLAQQQLTSGRWKIRISFYFGLVRLCRIYKMPIFVILDFFKILNLKKQRNLDTNQWLFDLAQEAIQILNFDESCRGSKIGQIKEIFNVFSIISDQLQKPYQILKIPAKIILQHLQNLNTFTSQQLQILQLTQIKEKTQHKILSTTLKIYQKFNSKDYLTHSQKNSIQQWIHFSSNDHEEYLPTLLMIFHKITNKQKSTFASQFNKLLNHCLETFSELSFNTQAAMVLIGLQRQFKNIKSIADILLNTDHQDKNNKAQYRQIRYFKKYQAVQLYTKLFNYWPELVKISTLTFHAYRQGTFTKLLLKNLNHYKDTLQTASLVANRLTVQPQFMQIFIKKYNKVSLENRTFSKKYFDLVQQSEFKQILSKCVLINNQKQDYDRLNDFYDIKLIIRIKIKRCLYSFRFVIQLLENLKILQEKDTNVIESEEFKTLFQTFDDELRCLYFRQLFTLQNFSLVKELVEYLTAKGVNMEESKLSEIWDWIENEDIQVPFNNPQKILSKVFNCNQPDKLPEDKQNVEIVQKISNQQ